MVATRLHYGMIMKLRLYSICFSSVTAARIFFVLIGLQFNYDKAHFTLTHKNDYILAPMQKSKSSALEHICKFSYDNVSHIVTLF